MTLLTVINNRTGAQRHYRDGVRIGAAACRTIKDSHRLDSFLTTIKGNKIRHYCCAPTGI
jgi:hypothetical protein